MSIKLTVTQPSEKELISTQKETFGTLTSTALIRSQNSRIKELSVKGTFS